MAGDIRRRLQLRNFGDELIPNPVLQKQIAHLEAIALERDEVDWDPEKDDYLLPNLDQSSMWPVSAPERWLMTRTMVSGV